MKKKLLKLIALLCAIACFGGLAACSGNDGNTDNGGGDDTSIDTPVDDNTEGGSGGNTEGGSGGNTEGGSGGSTEGGSGGSTEGGSGDNTEGGEQTKNTYSITFKDENGNVLSSTTVDEGAVPVYTYTPTDTDEWDYTFVGWSTTLGSNAVNITGATGNTTYYAVVSSVKKTYTVTFVSNGGDTVTPVTVEYGTVITAPGAPSKTDFKFAGWAIDAALTTAFDWSKPITANITLYAKWNPLVDLSELLTSLLNSYKASPYEYLPDSLKHDYTPNLVEAGSVITDESGYSSFVNVSSMAAHGQGQQLHMVINNIQQSMLFHDVLSVVDTLATTSIAAFNNYLDKNPSNTANYSFASGIYNVTINYDGSLLYYVLDYTADIPLFGEHTAQIALCLNTANGDKTTRIQIGDSNALKYTITENSYSFAIKYLGVRRAYFHVHRNSDNSIEGNIYEYITVAGKDIASAADFYSNDKYTTVVGNKGDGMIAFTDTISEVYLNSTGKLVGYEVEETLKSIVYNTLWFDLDKFGGINNIKYATTTDGKEEFFINGSSKAWEDKLYGISGGLKAASRRFDIEFRTQYFYSYNAQTKQYEEIKAVVPMLFVQQEVYSSLVSDVKSANSINITVKVTSNEYDQITSTYSKYLPVFKARKDNFGSQQIVDAIGNKITFTTKQ